MKRRSLRVIGGEYRGRRLFVPSGIRPTKDVVRESLFNVLGGSVCGKGFIDLFAGSGSVGIEALSRGASFVYFVDIDLGCVRVIRENLDILSLGVGMAFCVDIFSFLSKGFLGIFSIDYIFCDPPYNYDNYTRLIGFIEPILSRGSVLIVEHLRGVDISGSGLYFVRRRDYGRTSLSFFECV